MKIPLEILAQAINEYRAEGIELMERLGKKFGYDISINEQYQEFVTKSNPKVPRKGKLSERVNYAFHGGDYLFHKKKTQQNIEVILSNPPKFGKIDPWFLKSYMDSTKKYKVYSEDLFWEDIKPMLIELYLTGLIKEVK